MRSNCLWYALDRWVAVGGTLGLVHSMHICLPHVHHTTIEGALTQFVPHKKLRFAWIALLGFEGKVEVGDKDAFRREKMNVICIGIGTAILGLSGAVWLVTRTVQWTWRRI